MRLNSFQSGFNYKISFDPPRNSRKQVGCELLSYFIGMEPEARCWVLPGSCLSVWSFFLLPACSCQFHLRCRPASWPSHFSLQL